MTKILLLIKLYLLFENHSFQCQCVENLCSCMELWDCHMSLLGPDRCTWTASKTVLKPECIRAYALGHNVKYKLMWEKCYCDRKSCLELLIEHQAISKARLHSLASRSIAESDSKALLDSAEETLALSNDMDFSEYRRQIGVCFNLPPWIQISVHAHTLTLCLPIALELKRFAGLWLAESTEVSGGVSPVERTPVWTSQTAFTFWN